jgi:hypothetical protein
MARRLLSWRSPPWTGKPQTVRPFRGPTLVVLSNAIIAGRCASQGIALHGKALLR